MAEIRCGNCGGVHGSVAEVRSCHGPTSGDGARPADGAVSLIAALPVDGDDAPWATWADEGDWVEAADAASPVPAGRSAGGRVATRAGGRSPDTARSASGRNAGARSPSGSSGSSGGRGMAGSRSRGVAVDAGALAGSDPARLAGPDVLGRSLVVAPGASVAAPWAGARRVTIDAGADGTVSVPPELLADLQGAWSARERLVIEVAGDLPEDPPVTAAPWELGPAFEFVGERIAALVFGNAIDARDPACPRWEPLARAVALGASLPTPADDPSSDGPPPDGAVLPDAVLPDGTAVLVDGGPLDPIEAGLPVLAAASLEAGVLRPLGTDATSAELAPDQLAAVSHAGGGARIIAPAGSGKTRVLTERARHLLTNWRVPARSLTLVAFNVRAAEEMRERTADLPELHVRTLNSLGLAIVNGGGPFLPRPDGRRLATIDEREVRSILENLVRFPRRAGSDPAAPWLEALSAVRLGLRDPAEVEDDFGGDVEGFAEVLPQYRAELARRGQVDYDEQLCSAIERLLTDPAARAAAQRACRVMLVDEFQDLAPAHLLLVRLLTAPGYDCFGVGDDDQTIYGYVGANPDWLVRFEQWFPGSGSHALEVNYRCPPLVVTGASNLLTRNRKRVSKTILARPGREPVDGELAVAVVADPVAETVERVAALVSRGVAPAEIAVLTRVNVTLLPVQLWLASRGIPTTAPVDDALLTRSGVRAALGWLTLATAPDRLSAAAVADAARRPPRGLSPKLLEWMSEQRAIDGLHRLASRLSQPRDAEKVEAFADDVVLLAGLAASGTTEDVLTAVRDRLGLGAAMETLDRSRRDVDRSAHGDDLAALIAVARLHPDPAGFGAWLRRQLQASTSSPQGVQLATVHKVKGREWPYVVVHEVSAALLPHRLASDVEEERRVFHVGVTRSSRQTIVVADAGSPSPFLTELAEPGEPPAVFAPLRAAREPVRSAGRRPATGGEGENAPPEVVAALKSWRLERARRDGVPPYVVLHDKNLEIIATRRPGSLVELSRCPGIGPAKLDRYGDELLGVLASVDG